MGKGPHLDGLQAAIARLQNTAPGLGQLLARVIRARAQRLASRGGVIEVHRVPRQVGVKDNKQAERTTNVSAYWRKKVH